MDVKILCNNLAALHLHGLYRVKSVQLSSTVGRS